MTLNQLSQIFVLANEILLSILETSGCRLSKSRRNLEDNIGDGPAELRTLTEHIVVQAAPAYFVEFIAAVSLPKERWKK